MDWVDVWAMGWGTRARCLILPGGEDEEPIDIMDIDVDEKKGVQCRSKSSMGIGRSTSRIT